MPRIDPLDLLKCLAVLLSPNGGIKGPNEVERIARLMYRFSKKLVSKCIYIHVLKATSTDLLDSFLTQNGWFLVQTWLTDALQTRNTPLLLEILQLLQQCPISENRLKDNNVSQMIQSIAQEYNDANCRNLATQLWTRWFVSKPAPVQGADVGNAFALSGQEESILPEDMDLSIYAPDPTAAAAATTSAASLYNYNDSLNMNLTDDVTSMTMGALSTLDMQSYAPYMENNDYYSAIHSDSSQSSMAMNNMMNSAPQANFIETPFTVNGPLPAEPMPMQVVQAPWAPEASVMSPVVVNSVNSSVMTCDMNQKAVDTSVAPASAGLPVLKIVTKGGTPYVVSAIQLTAKDTSAEATPAPAAASNVAPESAETKEKKEKSDKSKDRSKDKKKESSKKSSSSSKSSSSKSSSSKEEKEKKSSDSSDRKKSEKERSSSSKSSSSSSREKSKSSSSSKDAKSAKSKSRDDKKPKTESKDAKQAEKDLETLATIKALTSSVKLGKIPRKKPEETSSGSPADAAAASASPVAAAGTTPPLADVLDKLQRPKTVKMFNSKFRSTGLVEELAKSPAPGAKKPIASPSSLDKKSPSTIKRSAPSDGAALPMEKKLKAIDDSAISAAVAAVMKKTANETKPAIKLISARPRPALQDSSLFMDALEAGSKAEPRKRKRRTSTSKDDKAPTTPEQPSTPTLIKSEPSPAASTVSATSPVPAAAASEPPATSPSPALPVSPTTVKPMFKFYQDTLETDETPGSDSKADGKNETSEVKAESSVKEEPGAEDGKEDVEMASADENSGDRIDQQVMDETSSHSTDGSKPKGVLVIHSQMKKRTKKSVQWRTEDELEMYHYFELDETERVNVNKLQAFGDMKQAERERERQAFKMSKHMVDEEAEENKQPWRGLIPIDLPPPAMDYGSKSEERKTQAARESATLQAIYFKGQILPDSPAEPDPEVPLERTDRLIPATIPLDDVTGNPESVYDHRHIPWPEPKVQSYGQHFGPPVQYNKHVERPMPIMEPVYPDRPMNIPQGHPVPQEIPLHGPMSAPQYHHGGGGPPSGAAGTWMAGDGSIYPDHEDGPPHHHQQHMRYGGERGRRSPPLPPHRGHGSQGYGDMDRMHGSSGPSGQGYMGPPRGMNMDGPRPRFHGPPSRGSRSGGGGGGGRGGGGGGGGGGGSSQPCWHYMRGFCRLENRCKFLHPGYNGPQMP